MKNILWVVGGLLMSAAIWFPLNVYAVTTLSVQYGGTATSSFQFGLVGSNGGTTYLRNFATSSLGLKTSDVSEGTNLYYTLNRWATALAGTTTNALAEGSNNLYYTMNRWATALAGTTTNALAEGSNNLYWTQARFNTAFGLKSTSDLVEGSRLYYTDARVDSRVDASTTIPHVGGTAFGDVLRWSGSSWVTTSTSSLNINVGVISNSCPGGFLSCAGVNPSSFTLGTNLVANGGTGQTTFTASRLLYGNGTNAITSVATSSLVLGSEFSFSGTAGALVGGVNGMLTIATNGIALSQIAQASGNTVCGNKTGVTGNITCFATSTLGLTQSFAAHLSSDQTVSGGAIDKLVMDSVDVDSGGTYSSANRRWTPGARPVAIHAFALATSYMAGDVTVLRIAKNGNSASPIAQVVLAVAGGFLTGQVSVYDLATSTTYYEMYIAQGANSATYNSFVGNTAWSGVALP